METGLKLHFQGVYFQGSSVTKLERSNQGLANLYFNWIDLTYCIALVNKSKILIEPAKFYSKSVFFLCILKTVIPVVDKNRGWWAKIVAKG